MDTLTLLGSIGLLWGVAVIVPGPDTLMIANVSARTGRVCALAAVAGIVSGTLVFWTAGFLGVAALFEAAPWSYRFLRIAGALYLLYLGLGMIRASMRAHPRKTAGTRRTTAVSAPRAFMAGLTVNLSNPKTALFVASLYASALPPTPPAGLVGAVTLMTASLSAVWYGIVAVALTTRKWQELFGAAEAILTRLFGALFVVFGVRLILDR